MATQECTKCKGRKTCLDCFGSGRDGVNNCSYCRGTGKCAICNGTGREFTVEDD